VEVVSKHPLPPRIHTHYCPGHEAGKGYPDFMISKIYPDNHGGYTRKILSPIEAKRDNSTSNDAIMQLASYIKLAGDQSHDERLRSYLVLGHKFVALEYTESPSYTRAPPDEHPVLYAPGSNSLVEELCRLAFDIGTSRLHSSFPSISHSIISPRVPITLSFCSSPAWLTCLVLCHVCVYLFVCNTTYGCRRGYPSKSGW